MPRASLHKRLKATQRIVSLSSIAGATFIPISEMRHINRSAILVRLKEPYLRWASSIDEEAPRQAEMLRNHTAVYLVDDLETPAAERRMLKKVFPLIFEAELAAW